ncbi:MAG: MFS transporter [Deltaproteobacteria bacterium SG8_13]|nr:MAG: MFS transporter [Deltaproteobacteria bacterium SG8_13]
MEAKTVTLYRKLAYSSPAFALAVVGIPVYVYVPKFYTDTIGLNISVLGTLLFGVRIFDAVTDPLFGYLSDKTRTSFGRRRPYIAVGSLFVAISMFMLFVPPKAASGYAALWFGVSIYTLFLFWTAVTVPYESLGPEITFDYNERTSLFAMRDGLLIAGTLAAASSPALVQWAFSLPDGAEGERLKYFWIAVLYTPLLVGTCWWCAIAIKEKFKEQARPTQSLATGMRELSHNRPFRILLVSYTISAIGNNLPATLILYYVEYVLLSDLAELFLLLYFVTGIVCLPGWIKISHRFGKKNAWLASIVLNTGAFIWVFFLGPGDVVLYAMLVVISGIGLGATLALPSAIQADVIDYDELLSGARREGQYIGLWSISKKFAAAVGVGAGLYILGLAGYTPNAEQSATVVFTLRILYALVPSVCNLIAFGIALSYPISQGVHNDIRQAISRRQVGQQVADPLQPDRLLAGLATP